MFVVDTNVVSELRKAKSGRADPGVVAWAQSVPASALFLSVITVLELEARVLKIQRRDPVQGSTLRAWVDHHVLPSFAGRILSIDTAIARRCAELHIPDPRQECDALIAATALVHGMTVVTRNLKDFEHTGAHIFNPWSAH